MFKKVTNTEGFTRYIECGYGWDHLVQPLLVELEQLGGKILQVKEKFGGLRFYYLLEENHLLPNNFAQKVDEAELQSVATCEVCGEPGFRRSGGWIKTLCDQHHQERQAKIAER